MNIQTGLKSVLNILIAAALIAGILAGCGAKTIEINAKELTEATEFVTMAEEAEGLIKETLTAEDLSKEETDEEPEKTVDEAFPGYFRSIANYSYLCDYVITYNDKTENNLTFALETIGYAVWNYCTEKYEWPDSCRENFYTLDQGDEPDPLGQFQTCSFNRYDADKIDWILINIFNVKPDHSYNSKLHSSAKLDNDFDCYYYQGYYYAAEYYKTSRAELPETKIEARTQKENGDYEFTVCGYENLEGKKIFTYTLTAQKNRIDGLEVWKLISIEEKTTPSLQEARDNDRFFNIFWNIAYYSFIGDYKIVYRSDAKNNLTFALDNINNDLTAVWNCCEDQYNWPSSCFKYYPVKGYNETTDNYIFEEPDPLGKFGSCSYGYDRLDGDKVDWILINVFNVKPDHSYDSDKHKTDKIIDCFNCYYCKGYYYYPVGDSCFETDLKMKIISKTKNSRGDYVFKLTGYNYPFENCINYNYTVVARKHKVDGLEVWKLLSVKETDTPFTAEEKETVDFLNLFTTIASFRSACHVNADYGVNSADKLAYALNYISGNSFFRSLWSYCDIRFDWPDSARELYYNGSDNEYVPDPLQQFGSEEYVRMDGKKVDWILKNMLNVTPDHSFNTKKNKSDDSELVFEGYYYEGNYYFTYDYGDAGISDFGIDSKTNTGGNEYEFRLSANDPKPGTEAVSYTVTAQLNKLDGQWVWKLISFRQNDLH